MEEPEKEKEYLPLDKEVMKQVRFLLQNASTPKLGKAFQCETKEIEEC